MFYTIIHFYFVISKHEGKYFNMLKGAKSKGFMACVFVLSDHLGSEVGESIIRFYTSTFTYLAVVHV